MQGSWSTGIFLTIFFIKSFLSFLGGLSLYIENFGGPLVKTHIHRDRLLKISPHEPKPLNNLILDPYLI
jgi:hypothetical protein